MEPCNVQIVTGPNQQTPWTIIGAVVAIAIIAAAVIVVSLKKRHPTAKIDKV